MASEDRGDDPARDVFVHTGQHIWFDQQPGFFFDFTDKTGRADSDSSRTPPGGSQSPLS
jgi:hypothetical protein